MGNYLFISDAAREVKVESHVLRYWEEELHLPIKRNELGHRYYTEEDVERFKQIKGMKERGLQLKAIKMILKDGKLDVLSTEETGEDGSVGARNYGQMGDDQDMGSLEGEPMPRASQQQMAQARKSSAPKGMAIDIISTKEKEPVERETREDKSRRLQWLLQQLIRQTLQENNMELCREIRDSVVKELDYQFRMQEERDEERDRLLAEQNEEHFRRMDELLRKKSRTLRKVKPEKEKKQGKGFWKKEEKKVNQEKQENQGEESQSGELQETLQGGGEAAVEKKKRRFF